MHCELMNIAMTVVILILHLTYFSVYQVQSLPYNYKVDIYSLGVILFELLVPFGTDMERSYALMDVRNNKFPAHFQQKFLQEVRSFFWWGGSYTWVC